MNIFLSLSAAPGITSNYLVVAVYDSSAPTAVVASQVFNAPHSAPVNVEFTGLDPVIYIVKTFESTDGTPSGVLRHQFIATPENENAVSREDLFITAGVTSGFNAGATEYVDTTLGGWNYTVEQRGVGSLVPGIDIQLLTSGGWQFINGYEVQGGEVFIHHFQPTITVQAGSTSQVAGKVYSDEVTITGDVTLDATYLGKVLRLQGATALLNVTLPPSGVSPNMKLTDFMSEGGSHIMVNLIASGSDTIEWIGQGLASIALGQGEELEMYNYNGVWRIKSPAEFLKNVGELIYSFSKLIPNTLVCNGQELSRTQYPRLWDWISTKIDASLLVSDSTWALQDTTTTSPTYGLYPNKVKFSTGNGTTTFRLPVLCSSTQFGAKDNSNNPFPINGFLRAVDDSVRMPGTFEFDAVGNFKSSISGKIIQKSGTSNRIIALGSISDLDLGSTSVDGVLFNGKNAVTNNPNYETRPFNIGSYLLIRY